MNALPHNAPQRRLQSEKRLIRKGVAWNAAAMTMGKGSSILAKIVLARFLLPEHFGFYNMTVVFSSIIVIVADLGFRQGLIQRQRDHRTKLLYDSVFWLLFAASFALIGLVWLIGVPFVVWFYGEPRLAPIALAMCVAIVFQNFQVVPESRLARSMRFKQIALADLYGTLAGCVAALLLALAGANVWSLVAQTVVAAIVTCMITFAFSGWRPRVRMNLAILRDLGSYSRFIVGSRVLISFQQNLDYLLIGKLIGAYALGIYAIAFLLTETLRGKVYWLVSKAVFPFYSRAAGREEDIRTVYLGTVRYMSVTIFPAATVLILFAHYIVPALFTPKWDAAIVPIQILAAASMVVASAGTPGEVLRGVGRPDIDFRINMAVLILVAFPALWIGISWGGLPGAALAVLGHYCVSRLAYALVLWRLIRLPMLDLFRALQRPMLGSGLMAAIAMLGGPLHPLILLILAIAAYASMVFTLVLPRLRPFFMARFACPSLAHAETGDGSLAE